MDSITSCAGSDCAARRDGGALNAAEEGRAAAVAGAARGRGAARRRREDRTPAAERQGRWRRPADHVIRRAAKVPGLQCYMEPDGKVKLHSEPFPRA